MTKKFTRRAFLKLMAAGTCGAACHQVLMPRGMMAYAMPLPNLPSGKVKRLIEIFFYGGYCDYGFMPQFNNGAKLSYPTLYRSGDHAAHLINGHTDIGLHEAFKSLVAEAGAHIALIMKTGHPVFTLSHEYAQAAMERIDLDPTQHSGMGVGAAIMAALQKPFSGVAFGGISPFMTGSSYTARSLNTLENAGRPNFFHDNWVQITEENLLAASSPSITEEQKFIETAIDSMHSTMKVLQKFAQIPTTFPYPKTHMGTICKDINRMVLAGYGTIYFVPFNGFDTHAKQAAQQTVLFTELNDALTALIKNLKAIPEGGGTAWDHTVILTRTDFGRTRENNALGTDHGLAHNQLVIGGPIRGGIYGDVLTEQQYRNVKDYYGPSYIQFSSGQPTKEIVEHGMGLTNVGFPDYPGNLRVPIGFI